MKDVLELLSLFRNRNIFFSLDQTGENIRLTGDLKSVSDEDAEIIKLRKKDIVAILKTGAAANQHSILPAAPAEAYPLSSSQRRMWLMSQLPIAGMAYNISAAYTFEGDLSEDGISFALTRLLQRHEILRTVFRLNDDGELRQYIKEQNSIGQVLDVKDIRNSADLSSLRDNLVKEVFNTVFDLSSGPLFRLRLIRQEESRWILVFAMHHIISDGWSIATLIRELLHYYVLRGNENIISDLLPLKIQYKDYAVNQQRILHEGLLSSSREYWLAQFAVEPPVLEMPADKPRPVVRSYAGATIRRQIPAEHVDRFYSLLHEENCTLFVGLFTAVSVLLYRYTAQTDIVIGSPVAGRNRPELENQLGLFVNTLPLRTRFTASTSTTELLNTCRDIVLNGYVHQGYPFDELVEELNLSRDWSRNALFDVMMVLQNKQKNLLTHNDAGLVLTPFEDVETTTSKFDLLFNFGEHEDGLSLSIEYNSDIYHSDRIGRMGAHLEHLIAAMCMNPATSISALDYLSREEVEKLTYDCNKTDSWFLASDRTVVDMFESQVLLDARRAAVLHNGNTFTYGEINKSANRLGWYLKSECGIKKGDKVAFSLERNEWMVIAMLAILKTGAAYVPIDPEYPADRVELIVKDCGSKLLLNKERLEHFLLNENAHSEINHYTIYAPEDIIYAIYTSGSTGTPKGAMVKHYSFTNLVTWYAQLVACREQDVLLMMAPIGFDLAQKNVFTALISGAALCIPKEIFSNYTDLATLIEQCKVTLLNCAPSAFYPLLDTGINNDYSKLSSVKNVVLGGEPISVNELLPWTRSQYYKATVINSYGPTECTDVVSYYKVDNKEWEHITNIPIGKPVYNTQLYLLDSNRKLVPEGVRGEIYISGICLGTGYINNPGLTAAAFVRHFVFPGQLMYKTGDIGIRLPDGNILFSGRADEQLKIRGYRVEPAEIQHIIESHPSVDKAFISYVLNKYNEKELAAYIIADESLDVQTLRSFAATQLPAHMVPLYFYRPDSFPLTPNGKIDRRKLLDLNLQPLSANTDTTAAASDTEKMLIAIWEDILDIKGIGVNANIFESGMHSLKIIRLQNRLRNDLAVNITVSELLTHPTVSGQAALIESINRVDSDIIPIVKEDTSYPLSSAQRRMWLLSQFSKASVAYNIPAAYVLEGHLAPDSLSFAFERLLQRHEILRTVFQEDGQGEIRQVIIKDAAASGIQYTDMRHEKEQSFLLEAKIKEAYMTAFDLSSGPLLRLHLIQTADDRWILAFVMHHIISDEWSTNTLVRELLQYYEQHLQGRFAAEPPLRIQYKDYAAWQRAQLENGSLEESRTYWMAQLGGELPVLELPLDDPRPSVKTYNGGVVKHKISAGTLNRFESLLEAEECTLFMGLLATLNIILYRYSSQTDIIIGSPVAGRIHPELEDQLGLYVNTLAFRTRFSGEWSVQRLLKECREVLLGGYDHQAYPFDVLVEDLPVKHHLSRSVLFDVMLVLQHAPDIVGENGPSGLKVSTYDEVERGTGKFDLLFNFSKGADGLYLELEYNSNIYKYDRIERLCRHIENVLSAMPVAGGQPISKLDYLSKEEVQQLVYGFNATATVYPVNETVFDLFNRQVSLRADQTAVVFEDRSYSYGEIRRMCNDLSSTLLSRYRIGKGDKIGVHLERSIWSIVSMISVMEIGAVYVPVDTGYPAARISYILTDSGAQVLISDDVSGIDLPAGIAVMSPVTSEGVSSDISLPVLDWDDASYVIYTSGSTGQPKGVVQTHRMLYNLIRWDIDKAGLSRESRHLQYSSFSFDSSLHDVYYVFATGGIVHLVNETLRRDFKALQSYILSEGIQTLSMPYAALKALFSDFTAASFAGHQLREVISTGEQLYINGELRRFLETNPAVRVHNFYGPSETHVVTAASYTCDTDEIPEKASIGYPVSNSYIYVLDNEGALCGIGIDGELYIGGWNLALGYLGREDLTTQRFIADPFRGTGLMYRSGDIGRWDASGNLEYMLRRDDQIKINGYRIEIGEVESAIRSNEEIDEAVVTVHADTDGSRSLLAYYVSHSALSGAELKNWLGKQLPGYMLPSYYIRLEQMPLTTNGKVDKRRLPPLSTIEQEKGREYIGARTEIEEKLVRIWEDVLSHENIGVRDNFFDLGGHSLKATRVLAKVYKEFNVSLGVELLLTNPTIEGVANEIENANWAGGRHGISNDIEKISL